MATVELFQDECIDKILYHFRDRLNYLAKKNLGQKENIVRGIRNYDAYNVSLAEFPLLKVYRLGSDFVEKTGKKYSNIAVSYSLSYPENENLSAVCNNINNYIHHITNTTLENHINKSVNYISNRHLIGRNRDSQAVRDVTEHIIRIVEGF